MAGVSVFPVMAAVSDFAMIEATISLCVAPPGVAGTLSESKLESLKSRWSCPSIVKLSHLSPLTIQPRKGGTEVRSSSDDPVV